MRFLSALIVLLAVHSTSTGQILAAHLKDTKAAEKYKKFLVYAKGKYLLAGEIVPGGGLSLKIGADGGGTIQPSKDNQIFVADPGDPLKLPYQIEEGVKTKAHGGTIISVPNADVENWEVLMRDQTLIGLADEYKLRMQFIAEAKAAREKLENTTRAWADAHRSVINAYERLQSWLSGTLFDRAAKNLEKSVLAELKLMKDDAVAARTRSAKASVKKGEVPAELIEVEKAITQGKLRFGVMESKHLRIIYTQNSGSPEKALELGRLGEMIIEGFRRDFIDPNLGDDFGDPIPDEIFHEFWFGPEDVKQYEQFLEQYYRRGIGNDEHREERLKMAGTAMRGARGVSYGNYWKSPAAADQEGMIAHGLGHSLAGIVFNRDRGSSPIDWIDEGCGYFLSFEYLGRNSVTCKDWATKDYDHPDAETGEKTVGLGQRGEFNKLALAKGLPITEMSVKNLAAMDSADLAKAWSFFDYLAHKEGKKGLLWLRAGYDAAKDKSKFLETWRAATKEIFGEVAGDPLEDMDNRWKAFAQSSQKKDTSTKKVK